MTQAPSPVPSLQDASQTGGFALRTPAQTIKQEISSPMVS